MMQRVADYVISRLVDKSVRHVFMISGRGILYLTDALAKNTDIDAICTFHEQGASFAAMAYAANSNSIGACLISTGCASTNAVTAALCAWQDSIPCIFISGQNTLNETTHHTKSKKRTYGSQEANIIRIVEPITKYAVMVEEAEQIKYVMDRAISEAVNGRRGPVWIDIPLDIQNTRIDPNLLNGFNYKTISTCSNDAVIEIKNEIKKSKRPIILLGGGSRSIIDSPCLSETIEIMNIPVVFTSSAVDVYGSGNYLSIGAVGSLAGSRPGNFAIQNADYVLVLGSKLSSQTIGPLPDYFAKDARITVVDIDEEEHKAPLVKLHKLITCDIKEFLTLMKNEYREKDYTHHEWNEKCQSWKKMFDISMEKFYVESKKNDVIDLYLFADSLSKKISEKTTVITDAGLEQLIIPSTIKFKKGQKCLFPSNQGSMGFAIPAILGAHYSGSKEIVTVVGDGSIMMNIQELQIISSKGINCKIFVINNNMYAIIRKRQHDLFRERTIGNDPSDGVPSPDFKAIANCFGFNYSKITSVKELDDNLSDILNSNKRMMCEIICPAEQKYLHTSYAFDEKRKIVKRTLEDLSPFLDRETIKKELITKYIG